ncbi:MAG: acyl-CoA thioesterase [Flavobacteriaceae bacterium]
MTPFTLEKTVMKEHLDELNHVNNIQYLVWVQEVAKAHWEALTASTETSFHNWVVRSHHIEYKQAALLGDQINLRTYVAKSKGALSERIVEIVLKNEERVLAKCSTQWCYINKNTGRPEPLSESLLKLFSKDL